MFDIDGTLTDTDDIDEICFVQALREVFGFGEIDTQWENYPHCSDAAILESLCQQYLWRSATPKEIAAAQARFVALLNAAAVSKPFRQVPGAGDFLFRLTSASSGRFAVSLASGAWECSARLKLQSARLDCADIPAAFSDDAHAREDIMRRSLERAAAAYNRAAFERVIYFGDGIWDARASRNLGYAFFGVARDAEKRARLRTEGAREVFADYLDADAVVAALQVRG